MAEPTDVDDPCVSTELTAMMLATRFDFAQAERRKLTHQSDVAIANIEADDAVVRSEAERMAELAVMPMREFIGTFALLILGGNDATRNSMTGGLMAVLDSPDELDKAKADARLLDNLMSERPFASRHPSSIGGAPQRATLSLPASRSSRATRW